MDLITGRELGAIERRLDELEDQPLPPEIKQLLSDANTLLEQLHEMRMRRTRFSSALRDALELVDGRAL